MIIAGVELGRDRGGVRPVIDPGRDGDATEKASGSGGARRPICAAAGRRMVMAAPGSSAAVVEQRPSCGVCQSVRRPENTRRASLASRPPAPTPSSLCDPLLPSQPSKPASAGCRKSQRSRPSPAWSIADDAGLLPATRPVEPRPIEGRPKDGMSCRSVGRSAPPPGLRWQSVRSILQGPPANLF
jgi:hypothetical protein